MSFTSSKIYHLFNQSLRERRKRDVFSYENRKYFCIMGDSSTHAKYHWKLRQGRDMRQDRIQAWLQWQRGKACLDTPKAAEKHRLCWSFAGLNCIVVWRACLLPFTCTTSPSRWVQADKLHVLCALAFNPGWRVGLTTSIGSQKLVMSSCLSLPPWGLVRAM